jgi:hypothetical protein
MLLKKIFLIEIILAKISAKKIPKYDKICNRFKDSFYDEILGHNISLQTGKFKREFPTTQEDLIGSGNCGDVYRAKCLADNREYAFKEIETNGMSNIF